MQELVYLKDIPSMLPYFALVKNLGYSYDIEKYKLLLSQMVPAGYQQVAVMEKLNCLGLAGYWYQTRLYCGRYVELDNVIVNPAHRSKGIGKILCHAIEEEGKKNGCRVANLNAYINNAAAQRFYFREGYSILGFHFTKVLSDDAI